MEVRKKMEQKTIDYDIVNQFSGHQPNKGVELVEAARDIFDKVKGKAMQVAVKAEFITFDSIEELQDKLLSAAENGFSIRVYDENIGG